MHLLIDTVGKHTLMYIQWNCAMKLCNETVYMETVYEETVYKETVYK